jgi:hypothetical protein
MALVSSAGTQLERYEYTPYGQRTDYTHGYSPAAPVDWARVAKGMVRAIS